MYDITANQNSTGSGVSVDEMIKSRIEFRTPESLSLEELLLLGIYNKLSAKPVQTEGPVIQGRYLTPGEQLDEAVSTTPEPRRRGRPPKGVS